MTFGLFVVTKDANKEICMTNGEEFHLGTFQCTQGRTQQKLPRHSNFWLFWIIVGAKPLNVKQSYLATDTELSAQTWYDSIPQGIIHHKWDRI